MEMWICANFVVSVGITRRPMCFSVRLLYDTDTQQLINAMWTTSKIRYFSILNLHVMYTAVQAPAVRRRGAREVEAPKALRGWWIRAGLYLECSVNCQGCNGIEQAGWGWKSPSRVQGQSRGGGLGAKAAKPPEAIGTVKYCAYKTGFCASSVRILLLKHALKLKRHTVVGAYYYCTMHITDLTVDRLLAK